MPRRAIALPLVAALALGTAAQAASLPTVLGRQEAPAARNVVLFLGDGMGSARRLAGQLATLGAGHRLDMDSRPYAAMIDTTPADPGSVVSDSAATATAYATGV